MSGGFNVDVRQEGNVWILSTHGYLNNIGGEVVSERFQKLHTEGNSTFLIDLADTRIVNSIGVSILLEILEKTMETKGKLAFSNCAPIIEKTFQIMGLTQYATVYPSTEDALEALDT